MSYSKIAVVCPYRRSTLVERMASQFSAEGASVFLWAVDEVLPSVERWTKGIGPRPKPVIWNDLLPEYGDSDLVLFTDDDISFPTDFLKQYASAVERLNADLAQPALTATSYHSFAHQLARPGIAAREVTWADQMVFSMTRRLLAQATPFPTDAGKASWGIEFVARQVLLREEWRCFIIDETPVEHSFRPLFSSYSTEESLREMAAFLAKRGLSWEPIRTLAVVASDGTRSPPPVLEEPTAMRLLELWEAAGHPDRLRDSRRGPDLPPNMVRYAQIAEGILETARASHLPGADSAYEDYLALPADQLLHRLILLAGAIADRSGSA